MSSFPKTKASVFDPCSVVARWKRIENDAFSNENALVWLRPEWAEKKIKTAPHMFLKTTLKLLWSAKLYNWRDGNKNNLRTIEAQIVQKLKNEARPKFTGSYKKKRVLFNN